MLIAPNNIETNKIVRNRTFNFDTPDRIRGNLVLILTDTYDDYSEILTSKLFKPQQLFSAYTPRRIKPMNRFMVSYFQKDIYDIIREKSNNFIKIGKATLSSYTGKNVLYNTIPEYNETFNVVKSIKKADAAQHIYMQEFVQDMIKAKADELNYERCYVIFPITGYDAELRSHIQTPTSEIHTPLVEFLRSLRHNTFDKSKFVEVDRIIFYNPYAQAMVVMDPSDDTIVDNFLTYFDKINRLNRFNGKLDNLSDIEVDEVAVDQEDKIENTKEKIKAIVLNNVSKKLQAKLDDYDQATDTEKSIIASIDKKIDTYLSKDENTSKPFSDLVQDVENDKEVTTNAVKFIETKKLAQKQLSQLAKNLDKETEIINSIDELTDVETKFVPAEKVKAKLPKLLNDSVQYSSMTALDKEYNEKYAKKDLISVLTAFSDDPILPITIVDWNMVDTSDDFSLKDTLTVKYKTVDGKVLSFKIDIPKIFNGHYVKIKGNVYVIQKQITRLPIVKTKDDTVEIATNYNKITCTRTSGALSRRIALLKKVLQEHKLNPTFNIEYGYNMLLNSKYRNDIEYEELSTFLSKMSTMKYEINTNRKEVEDELELYPYPDTFKITDSMTPIGFKIIDQNTKYLLFIKNSRVYLANIVNGIVSEEKLEDDIYTFIVKDILLEDPNKYKTTTKAFVYSKCKFISVQFPIFVLCGLTEGISTVLKKAHVKYRVTESPISHTNELVEIKFKNKYFYYENTIENTMLLNVLYLMNPEDWDYEDMDTDEPYIKFCVDKLGLPIYVKQTVKINISKLVDPISLDVLNYLKLPTDPNGLLILASKMLTTNYFITKNDLCNWRIRGNEAMYAMLYSIIAEAYRTYQNGKLNGSTKDSLQIPQSALMSMMTSGSVPNVSLNTSLNPLIEAESSATCSMKGFRGINLKDAYTVELRSYDDSMDGILSANSTPFSGNVGVSRALSINPKLNSARGYIPEIDRSTLDAANKFSASEMLNFATSTHSDGPRVAMQVSQAKHSVPIKSSNSQLLTSGYDRTMPYMLSDTFCFKAKKDGMVESINTTEGIAILRYVDGTYDAVVIKETLERNSASGFYITQKLVLKYKVGESFKEGCVVAYNPEFFSCETPVFMSDGDNCTFKPGTLAKIAICASDLLFEDSTYISERLSNKCATNITMDKPIALGKNTIIHKMVNIGDEVEVGDEIINFTTSFIDPTTTEFLQGLIDIVGQDNAADLGNEVVKSKHHGTITDISIYYNVPFEELSESLQSIIKNYNARIEKQKKILQAKGLPGAVINLKTIGQTKETKINGTEFEGVLIIFYTTFLDKMNIGDKLSYYAALKGTVTRVASDEEACTSEFRPNEIVDGCSASSGVPSRMTMDVFQSLYGNKLLIELGRWIHSEWNK